MAPKTGKDRWDRQSWDAARQPLHRAPDDLYTPRSPKVEDSDEFSPVATAVIPQCDCGHLWRAHKPSGCQAPLRFALTRPERCPCEEWQP